jgi:hypothetical protein
VWRTRIDRKGSLELSNRRREIVGVTVRAADQNVQRSAIPVFGGDTLEDLLGVRLIGGPFRLEKTISEGI